MTPDGLPQERWRSGVGVLAISQALAAQWAYGRPTVHRWSAHLPRGHNETEPVAWDERKRDSTARRTVDRGRPASCSPAAALGLGKAHLRAFRCLPPGRVRVGSAARLCLCRTLRQVVDDERRAVESIWTAACDLLVQPSHPARRFGTAVFSEAVVPRAAGYSGCQDCGRWAGRVSSRLTHFRDSPPGSDGHR